MNSRLRSTIFAFSCLCPAVTGCDYGQVLGSRSSEGEAGSENAGTNNEAGSAGEARGGSNAGGMTSGGATSGGAAGAGSTSAGENTGGSSGSTEGGSAGVGGAGGTTGGAAGAGGTTGGTGGAAGCPETCSVVPPEMTDDTCADTEVFWRCPVTGESVDIPVFNRNCSVPPDAPSAPNPAEFCCAPTFYEECR
jgi:hypothetical protein